MSLKVRTLNDVVVLAPKGMLLGGPETDELQDEITDLDRRGNMKLLIDLGQVSFMSSMGLSTLFLARAKYTKRGAVVKLCRVDRRIRHIFILVGLTLVYGDDLCDTMEQALADFEAPVTSPATTT